MTELEFKGILGVALELLRGIGLSLATTNKRMSVTITKCDNFINWTWSPVMRITAGLSSTLHIFAVTRKLISGNMEFTLTPRFF